MKGYILAEWKKTKKVQLLAIGILFWILTSFIALFTYYYLSIRINFIIDTYNVFSV